MKGTCEQRLRDFLFLGYLKSYPQSGNEDSFPADSSNFVDQVKVEEENDAYSMKIHVEQCELCFKKVIHNIRMLN